MCVYDFEEPRLSVSRWRKARKKHGCFECGKPILPGQKYREDICIPDGGSSPERYRCHEVCHTLRVAIADNLCDGRYYIGGLSEEASSMRHDWPTGPAPWKRCVLRAYKAWRTHINGQVC